MTKTSPSEPHSSSAEFLDYVENLCDENVLGVVILSYPQVERLWALASIGDRFPAVWDWSHVRWVRTHVDYARWRLVDAVTRKLEQ
jgi:hypothetical protein